MQTEHNPDNLVLAELHEAIERLWVEVECLTPGVRNRLRLGQCFHELRRRYSERYRSAADIRRGHGTFEVELRRRGYKPRTARDLIADYLANLKGEPLNSAKRRARRVRRKAQEPSDPRAELGVLFSFEVAHAAYKAEARRLHPDCGGDTLKMQQLNAAWARAKSFYEAQDNFKTRMRAAAGLDSEIGAVN